MDDVHYLLKRNLLCISPQDVGKMEIETSHEQKRKAGDNNILKKFALSKLKGRLPIGYLTQEDMHLVISS